MRFATIGTSWITEKFISATRTIENMDLYAVYSRSKKTAEAFAEKHGAPVFYTDLNALAADKSIDSVYIASPNKLHYEQSKFLLQHNKNVFCEKPATTTKEQMEELIALAENNKLIYLEAIMTIHSEGFAVLKHRLGDIGIVRSAHFDFYQLSSKYQLYVDGKNPNIFNPEMHTGCLMDIGVYNLYLAAALFGRPEKIISDTVFLANGCDAAGTAILKYKDLSVCLNYSKTGQTYSYSEIIGDKGTIMFSSVSQLTGMYLINADSKEELIPEEVSRDIIMGAEAAFFLRMCETADYSDKDYIFAQRTALTVREICDTIRNNDSFLF